VSKGSGFFNKAEWEITLEPVGGGTRLTQVFTYLPQNAVAERMIAAAGPGGLEGAVAASLARLQVVLEQARDTREQAGALREA
jgi:hypothetical protein